MVSIIKSEETSIISNRIQKYPIFVEYDFIHYKQKFNWDCGLSCILMILPRKDRCEFLKNFNKICLEEDFGHSTWTIDLCFVLKRFNIPHKFFTQTIGINETFDTNNYYEKILKKDKLRVLNKFKTALEHDDLIVTNKSNRILIKQTSVSNDYLIKHLAKFGPIILLINSLHLSCDICKTNKLMNEFQSILRIPIQRKYTGHYILLLGYNLKVSKFFYRDPAKDNRICMTSFEKMTEARKSYGTDEDIILIYPKN